MWTVYSRFECYEFLLFDNFFNEGTQYKNRGALPNSRVVYDTWMP